MSKAKDKINELFKGKLVSVSVRGNKTGYTHLDSLSMVVSSNFFDESTRKEFYKLKMRAKRLPNYFSPPMNNLKAFIIQGKTWVHEKDIPQLTKDLRKVKNDFHRFVKKTWDKKLSEKATDKTIKNLYDDRSKTAIQKEGKRIAKVEQIPIPTTLTEFQAFFELDWDFKAISRTDSFFNTILENTKKQVDILERQIKSKESELATKKNLIKSEKEFLEKQINSIKSKKDNLATEVNTMVKEGAKDKEDKFFGLLDSQISLQLQEFYLMLQNSLVDFSDKGKVHWKKLSQMREKIKEIKDLNEKFGGFEQIDEICLKLDNLPNAIKRTQDKFLEAEGQLKDIEIDSEEIDFKGIKDSFKVENGTQSELPSFSENLLDLDLDDLKFSFGNAVEKAKESITEQQKEKASKKTTKESKTKKTDNEVKNNE